MRLVVGPEVEIVQAAVSIGRRTLRIPGVGKTPVGAQEVDQLVLLVGVVAGGAHVPDQDTVAGHVAAVVAGRAGATLEQQVVVAVFREARERSVQRYLEHGAPLQPVGQGQRGGIFIDEHQPSAIGSDPAQLLQ